MLWCVETQAKGCHFVYDEAILPSKCRLDYRLACHHKSPKGKFNEAYHSSPLSNKTKHQ